MSRHKKQHFVPECYLNAWCDPETPKNQTPYVWIFRTDGSNPRRKAPENIFHETDMYTIRTKDGGRDLRLEYGLQRLETAFTRIRNKKLNCRHPLDEKEHELLCAFIAATQLRTPASRAHHRSQWEGPRRMMEDMMEWSRTATPEAKRDAAVPMPSESSTKGLNYDQVRELHETPIQRMLGPMVLRLTPLLSRLDIAIFETSENIGFITSDHPCVWFDADAYRRPPRQRAPSLAYKTIEITLPISPRQCIMLNRLGVCGYRPATDAILLELNRRTGFNADEAFIVNRNESKRDWFDVGLGENGP